MLAKFTDDGREELKNILRGTTSPMIPQEVSMRIQSWIQNKTSQLLWVEGPVITDFGSGLSLTALRIYEVTMQAEIPCVSFFCKRRYAFMPADSTTSGATLMALLYTVMDQLINLLPPTFESASRLSLETLGASCPEGNMAALDVIEQLLSHAPPTVTFIVDGLELVTKATEIPHLIRFIELLRTAGGEDKVFKVLLTTNGNSRSLGKFMHWKERVDGSRFAQGRPGHLLRGATHLSEIG
ncbi:Carboxylic ester hydrolase [Apiospora rasikravindrae]|uniref:Carboxylic ester hydrolase n=1 Tax=Apiospora rasikravindrae TaxID=990691 RepID=A0ABR1S2S8_9PEZI